MSSPYVDWEQLDMIADGFAPEFVEIYREFLAEIPGLLETLRGALAANNAVEAAKVAHQIKGSASNFGFIGVSGPAADLERDAKAGSLGNARIGLEQAENGFRSAMAEVRSARGV